MILILFPRPAHPAKNVHTVQLPVAGCAIPNGTMCKVYGWGETKGTARALAANTIHVDRFGSGHRRKLRCECFGGFAGFIL